MICLIMQSNNILHIAGSRVKCHVKLSRFKAAGWDCVGWPADGAALPGNPLASPEGAQVANRTDAPSHESG